jgi:hypothetical protein
MTHFQPQRDASQHEQGESLDKTEIRACVGCGRDFVLTRSWQKQCTPRCRQRAYVQRKTRTPIGYYGA